MIADEAVQQKGARLKHAASNLESHNRNLCSLFIDPVCRVFVIVGKVRH